MLDGVHRKWKVEKIIKKARFNNPSFHSVIHPGNNCKNTRDTESKLMNGYGYIYKTENLINGRLYIGQNKGSLNSNYFGSGKLLKQALKTYGKCSFRIDLLAVAYTKEQLDDYEIKMIQHFRRIGCRLYNIADGGTNQPYLYSKQRFTKGSIPWNKGLHICLNTGRTHIKKGQIIGRVFEKGNIPWSKTVAGKGILKSNSGSFKKGFPLSDKIIKKRNLTNKIRLLNKSCLKKF